MSSPILDARAVARTPGKRGRPPKHAAIASANETILDVAEDLFSKHGFHGVTLREVAREAGVDTALVHYYFDTKRGLFDAVFLRRAEVLNRDRLESLDRYAETQGPRMTAEGLIDAFVAPVFEWQAKGGPGWKHYCALVAQVNATPVWGGETMTRYFDPVIHRLIDLMQQVLPQARPHDLYWAYHNLSGALTLTMGETGRIDRLSGGLCRSGDLDTARRLMVRYAASGFRAVCGD
jgi:AcrR family transcriptional regulator